MSPVMEHSSVPVWALEPMAQPFDPCASRCTILSYSGESVAADWRRNLDALSIPYRSIELAPRAQSAAGLQDSVAADGSEERRVLEMMLDGAVVGWRLLIAGALLDVLRARSLALNSGLLDAEIIVGTTSVENIAVTCAHCEAMTVVAATIGEVVVCVSCQEHLLIHHHLSRRRASFLGFKNNAEEWTPENAAAS